LKIYEDINVDIISYISSVFLKKNYYLRNEMYSYSGTKGVRGYSVASKAVLFNAMFDFKRLILGVWG